MGEPKNCHYIPRFLTTPWETTDRNRTLIYYDFRQNRIYRRSSRSLFARDRLNDAETERLLDRLIETPASAQRAAIVRGETDLVDARAYRSIALLLMLQASRSSAVLDPNDDSDHLAKMIRLSHNELDQLVALWLEKHHLIRYAVPQSKRLLFPSTGVFAVPVVDPCVPGQYDFAYAMPIHPRVFIARVSETAHVDGLERRDPSGNFYSIASVGLHADLVLLPPEVVSMNSEDHLRETIEAWRQQSRDLASTLLKRRELIEGVHRWIEARFE